MTRLAKTGERVLPGRVETREEHLMYLRHLAAYRLARDLVPRPSSMVEIGSGEGYGASFLSRFGHRVLGLDVDAGAVAHAAARYGTPACTFESYDGRRIPYPAATFDAAISFQCIEHVDDDAGMLSEMARVLKPRRPALVTTPNRLLRLRPGERPWNRFHLREYDRDELASRVRGSFPEVALLGLRATREIEALELARLRRIRRLVAWDPLGLRRWLPESVRAAVLRLLRPAGSRRAGEAPWRGRYRVDDYFVSERGVEESLDLVAVAWTG